MHTCISLALEMYRLQIWKVFLAQSFRRLYQVLMTHSCKVQGPVV